MRKIIKLFILLVRNSPLFNVRGFRRLKWFLYRTYYRSPQLYVGEKVIISMAHFNKDAHFLCKGEVNIGADTYIDYSGGITMGDKIAISEGVKIFTHNHKIHDGHKNWKQNPIVFSSLKIEDYVWVGAGSIILPSVTHIAEGSIIGAGAILAKNTEPYGVYTGNPAQKTTNRRILD
ncbi:acyltransferase [Dokdonia pacifica]|nr:acyltransferase [Dokdonia pacifica]